MAISRFFGMAILTAGVSALVPSLGAGEAYVGAAGALWLPQGGSRVERVGGAAVRSGYYFDEDALNAIEGEAGWLEDAASLAVREVWHWQNLRIYRDLFGYDREDPFLTLGVAGLLARRGRGQVGPELGVGTFYHLTDNLSIRGDMRAILGLDTEVEVHFEIAYGLQYSF